MVATCRRLAERLEADGLKTKEFFLSLTPAQWRQPIYTEGSCWEPVRILGHFVISEKAFARLLAGVQAGGPGAAEDFDINRYNESQVAKLGTPDPANLLAEFEQARQANATWVAGLEAADLARTGRHPFLGVTTLEEMIKMIYRHNQIHIREMRKALASI